MDDIAVAKVFTGLSAPNPIVDTTSVRLLYRSLHHSRWHLGTLTSHRCDGLFIHDPNRWKASDQSEYIRRISEPRRRRSPRRSNLLLSDKMAGNTAIELGLTEIGDAWELGGTPSRAISLHVARHIVNEYVGNSLSGLVESQCTWRRWCCEVHQPFGVAGQDPPCWWFPDIFRASPRIFPAVSYAWLIVSIAVELHSLLFPTAPSKLKFKPRPSDLPTIPIALHDALRL